MADDGEMKDVQQRVESLEKSDSFLRQLILGNYKEFEASEKDLLTQIADLKKQLGDPKEIADLKARVKELETKLGKMGKK